MSGIIQFMHVSLDGFVAGPKGEMNWIAVSDDMFDFVGERTNESDTALYGRATYQMMEAYWPKAAEKPGATKHDIEHSRWYNKVMKVVLSRTMKGTVRPKTKIISDNLTDEIAALKRSTDKDIFIFGSPSAGHSLASANLIDEYWLFVNPILVGRGIPMFKDIKDITKLALVSTRVFSSGVVCLNYKVDRG